MRFLRFYVAVDVAERRFDGSSWDEVSERKLQAGFIKKIDCKKNLIFRGINTSRIASKILSRGG